ncbi:MAG: glycoside hydrolase [Bacteroidales bacterium]|nr:glycoside hydrolase [Bacteroidales bacterium]
MAAADTAVDSLGSWTAFRKDVCLNAVPAKAVLKISADSKYWLWINGELAVFEGGLKRGPARGEGYYDEVDVAPYLKKGRNRIAVLLWYFGKNGFSHQSSGKAGLLIDAPIDALRSGKSYYARLHPAYGAAKNPKPNYRLSESNIRFDERENLPDWQTADPVAMGFRPAVERGHWGDAPWGALTRRMIPQWKDYGIREATFRRIPGAETDSIVAPLPYNMQMTPIVTVRDAVGGHLVKIETDHTYHGGAVNLRAEYITAPGSHRYESLGWMNGENIILLVPAGVEIERLQYRETGYDTAFEGTFSCDDAFLMRLWGKGLRTLYVNMRDNFFDCPDRERAQWWGDVTEMMGESFYTLSLASHALMRKAIGELCRWQRPDSILFSPVPAGNYKTELPAQMLASIGLYGFWNYYMHTGDAATIRDAYPAVKRYLGVWKLDETGLTAFHSGGWNWGDWGSHKDMRLLYAGWHYIALDAAARMAELLGYPEEACAWRETMVTLKTGFNKNWNGYCYRHPAYLGATDDRVQALAVVAGLADSDKYEQIARVLKSQRYASPYMEKYVLEAYFKMGLGETGLERMRKRYAPMVNDPVRTTLFEGWGLGEEGFGGGTSNHAWSAGPIIVTGQYLCGIYPLEAGYRRFMVAPQPAGLRQAAISFPTVAGTISSAWTIDGSRMDWTLGVPEGTQAIVYVDEQDAVTQDARPLAPEDFSADPALRRPGKKAFACGSGTHQLIVERPR